MKIHRDMPLQFGSRNTPNDQVGCGLEHDSSRVVASYAAARSLNSSMRDILGYVR